MSLPVELSDSVMNQSGTGVLEDHGTTSQECPQAGGGGKKDWVQEARGEKRAWRKDSREAASLDPELFNYPEEKK